MSNESFSVDTDGLNRNVPFVQELAARIGGIGEGLRATMEELGPCWGDDLTGNSFLDQYQSPSEDFFVGVKGGSTVLSSTAVGIRTMAVNFQRTEDQNQADAALLTDHPAPRVDPSPGGPVTPGIKAGPKK